MISALDIRNKIHNDIFQAIQNDTYTDSPDTYELGPYFHGNFDKMLPYQSLREYINTRVKLVGTYIATNPSTGLMDPLSGVQQADLIIPDLSSLVLTMQSSVVDLATRDAWLTTFVSALSGSSSGLLKNTPILITPIIFNSINSSSTVTWKNFGNQGYNDAWLAICTIIANNLNNLVGMTTPTINGAFSGTFTVVSIDAL